MLDYLSLGTELIIVVNISVFVLGLLIGSFLNVCIYRIPLKQDIAITRSHCMKCGHELSWYELIPVLSFAIQGGKCRKCKTKISWQYPIIELTNAVLWMAVLWIHGLCWETALYCACTSVLIIITVIDFRTFIIPLGLNITIAVLGAIMVVLNITTWYNYVIGFFTVSVLFLLIWLVTKGRGIGDGDIKLMAAAGLLLGWKEILLAMMIGCILGSIIHPIRMKVSKKDHMLAFGPYLAAGIYTSILFGEPIIDWYMGFFG